jgi:hypothetical protein
MKTAKLSIPCLAWAVIVMLMIPSGVTAQYTGQTAQTGQFSKEELAQMLAQIALYPDSLIADILMASTYPIEVVEAERWVKQNGNLKGAQLDTALQEKTWDSSVKSLCHFPDILFSLSDNLERTTRLGDAFLGQQDTVMHTIQELRTRAGEQGNLRTTEQQKVIVEQQVIKIEPADPRVVFVPVYNPLYVYGPWWYPAYPPYYWYYPPGPFITGGFIGFGSGIFFGAGIYSWNWIDWHYHRIHVDIHKTKRFNRFDRGRWDSDRHIWKHQPEHRRGVAYRDRSTGQHFRIPASRPSGIRPEARGYPDRDFRRQPAERQGGSGTPGRRTEQERGQRPPTGQKPSIGQQSPRVQRPQTEQRPSNRSNAFSGIGSGKFEYRTTEHISSSHRYSGSIHGKYPVRDMINVAKTMKQFNPEKTWRKSFK